MTDLRAKSIRRAVCTAITFVAFSVSTQSAFAGASAKDISGAQMVGPATALIWAESAQKFRIWRVQLVAPPEWTEVAIPTELSAFERMPKNPDLLPYVAVNVEAGVIRLLWLQHSDCETKGWDRLQHSESTSPCQFTLYQAEGEVAAMVAHPERLGTWTVTKSLLTDAPEAVMESVNQIKMLDRQHGWMILQGASQMNRMPEALVTSTDGHHWIGKATLPVADDLPQILLPRSVEEAWFAAIQPFGIWHTLDGGKAWTRYSSLPDNFPGCTDCSATSVWDAPPVEGRPCLEFLVSQMSTDASGYGQHQVRQSIARFCTTKDGRAWTEPEREPIVGGGNEGDSASATIYADTRLAFSTVTVIPGHTSTIFETTDGGAKWQVAALKAAGTDSWVEEASTNGRGVLLLLSSWNDGNTKLLFSADSGLTWTAVALPASVADVQAVSQAAHATVNVRVPQKLKIERTPSTVAISVDQNSCEAVEVTVDANLATGVMWKLYAYPANAPRPSQPEGSGVGSGTDFNLGSAILNSRGRDFPVAGQPFVIEMDLSIFATPVPSQHMWNAAMGGNYRILWQRVIKRTVD